MKSYSSRDIIAILKADGWENVRTEGSHHHFRHPTKSVTVTVTHPKKDFPFKTVKTIFSQAGIKSSSHN